MGRAWCGAGALGSHLALTPSHTKIVFIAPHPHFLEQSLSLYNLCICSSCT